MGRPRSNLSRRLKRLLEKTARLSQVLDLLSLVDELEKLDTRRKPRSTLMSRERRPWLKYIAPMLGDGTFKRRFRMGLDDFNVLVGHLRPALERDAKMGALRNGAVPVEYQIGMGLRYLAGATMYEGMDGHVISRSTANQTTMLFVRAVNKCSALDSKWPMGLEEISKKTELFEKRSSEDVITKCVGAMDGLFIRMIRPTAKDHAEPNVFYSGHKKGFGMNLQAICDAEYRIIAWSMNAPGSVNDRTAFKFSGLHKFLGTLPPDHYIVDDAAYPASHVVLVPFPGTKLSTSQDAHNFYQSQCRMAIEQTFGILVRRWGVLWKPLEHGLENVQQVVSAVVRLHNFCRDRSVRVPTGDAGRATVPAEVRFNDRGELRNYSYFETAPVMTGRPSNDPSGESKPREDIRHMLEVSGMGRPAHNLARNRNRVR